MGAFGNAESHSTPSGGVGAFGNAESHSTPGGS